MARLVPSLVADYDHLGESDPLKAKLKEPVSELRGWDFRWSAQSVPTTLAALWGDEMWTLVKQDPDDENVSVYEAIADHAGAQRKLATLGAVVDRLTQDFGTWRVAWSEVNRYQRLSGDITQHFSDAGESIPVPFTSARWGSLASFGARRYAGTAKYYGTSGNSFVAIVEFGARVTARAVSIGGENGDPKSPHFADQAARYAEGALRPVYFYPADLVGHVERDYRPR